MLPRDDIELQGFLRAAADGGVHVVFAAEGEGIAAAALLARALKRGGVHVAGMTAVGFGERFESPATRAWLADAPALLVVGLGAPPPLSRDVPQLAVDSVRGAAHEPLAARAFRLGETIAPLGDAVFAAAVGLVGRAEPHVLVERALARHARGELDEIAALLGAASRGPQPASESLLAAEMLAAAPDPRRFLASIPAEVLRRTQELVRVELTRANRIRPRPGFGVVVVEYESRCHLEDLVAERWRGLRPGTVVLVGNHGCVDGQVAVAARCAVSEALDRLRSTLGDEGTALLDLETWTTLIRRLGVPPTVIERTDGDAGFDAHALLN